MPEKIKLSLPLHPRGYRQHLLPADFFSSACSAFFLLFSFSLPGRAGAFHIDNSVLPTRHHFCRGKTSAFIYNGYWEDIGTISAYYQANLALTNDQNWMQSYNETNQLYTPHNNMTTPLIKATAITNSLINQGALIEAKEVTHSIVGLKTWIKEHTIVRDCIITGEHCPTYSVVIGKNCILQKAIIDSDVIIGDNVHLINQKNVQKFDSDYVFIRDGIIIITSGARLPDGFVI